MAEGLSEANVNRAVVEEVRWVGKPVRVVSGGAVERLSLKFLCLVSPWGTSLWPGAGFVRIPVRSRKAKAVLTVFPRVHMSRATGDVNPNYSFQPLIVSTFEFACAIPGSPWWFRGRCSLSGIREYAVSERCPCGSGLPCQEGKQGEQRWWRKSVEAIICLGWKVELGEDLFWGNRAKAP